MKPSIIVFAACLGSLLSGAAVADDSPPPIADAHLHMLDFLQNGDYLEEGALVEKKPGHALPAGERGKYVEAVLWAMDEANVSHALLSGMPFVKRWSENDTFRSGYYLDSASRVVVARDTDYHLALALSDYRTEHGRRANQQLDRLFPCVSGFDGTDIGAVDMIAKRMQEFPGTFRCIGEVMSHHDDLTNLTSGSRPRGNHPAFYRIFDFAGQHGIPVSIHHNITAISRGDETKPTLYLQELLDAFNAFPYTRFVWCHAGISRRINVENLPATLDGILEDHAHHVTIDLSWVVYPDYILKDLERWVALIKKYPDSFVLGSDAVGSYARYKEEIRNYDTLLTAIDDPVVAQKLAHDNFLAVMPTEGITLPKDYLYPADRYVRRGPPLAE